MIVSDLRRFHFRCYDMLLNNISRFFYSHKQNSFTWTKNFNKFSEVGGVFIVIGTSKLSSFCHPHPFSNISCPIYNCTCKYILYMFWTSIVCRYQWSQLTQVFLLVGSVSMINLSIFFLEARNSLVFLAFYFLFMYFCRHDV